MCVPRTEVRSIINSSVEHIQKKLYDATINYKIIYRGREGPVIYQTYFRTIVQSLELQFSSYLLFPFIGISHLLCRF